MKSKITLNKKKYNKFKKKYKIGLCLSGGGTRGFAHLGAFKAFEEYGIKFDAVAGTSIGAICGALYATGVKSEEILKYAYGLKTKDFRQAKLGFLPSKLDNLQQLLKNFLPYKNIEELPIPYYAVAVDLKTGKEVVFSSGDIASVATASSALPGVFLPVKYKGMTLIDGGVLNNIPSNILRDNGCDFVVTVDCNPSRGAGTNSENIFSQFSASIGIMIVNNSKYGIMMSNIVIRPDMKKFHSMKISNTKEMVDQGYKATIEAMPEIVNLLNGNVKKYKKRNKIFKKL